MAGELAGSKGDDGREVRRETDAGGAEGGVKRQRQTLVDESGERFAKNRLSTVLRTGKRRRNDEDVAEGSVRKGDAVAVSGVDGGSGGGGGHGSHRASSRYERQYGSSHNKNRQHKQQRGGAGRRHGGGSSRRCREYHRDEEEHLLLEYGDVIGDYRVVRFVDAGTFARVYICERVDRARGGGDAPAYQYAVKVVRRTQKYREAARVEVQILEDLGRHADGLSEEALSASGNRSTPAATTTSTSTAAAAATSTTTEVAATAPDSVARSDLPICFMEESFEFERHVCIVFRLYGMSLYTFVDANRRWPLPPPTIADIGFQLLKGLAWMHELTLIHTDLKPENILLVDDSYGKARVPHFPAKWYRVPLHSGVKIIDFGGATFSSRHHASVIQTRHYRAPEVILDLGWSYAADIWSVGCILFELYTGEPLFMTHDNDEHLRMIERVCGPVPPGMAVANASKRHYFEPAEGNGYAVTLRPGWAHSQNLRMLTLPSQAIAEADAGLLAAITAILQWDPETRPTAAQLLQMEVFAKCTAATGADGGGGGGDTAGGVGVDVVKSPPPAAFSPPLPDSD